MAVNSNNNTMIFSVLVVDEKEKFIRNVIKKHLDLARFMANIYRDNILLRDHALLMEEVYKTNIPKLLADQLNGTLTID